MSGRQPPPPAKGLFDNAIKMHCLAAIFSRVTDLDSHQTDDEKLIFTRIPSGGRHRDSYTSWQQMSRSPCSPYMDGNRNANLRSLAQFESTMSLNDKKMKVRQTIALLNEIFITGVGT